MPETAEGLRYLPLAYPHALRELQIILRNNTTLSPAAEVFVEMLMAGVAAFGSESAQGRGRRRASDGVPLIEVAPP